MILPDPQEVVPMLRDRGRTSEVRLDHPDEPRLARREAVPVEKPLEIGEQEAVYACEPRDARVDGVQAPPEHERRQRR